MHPATSANADSCGPANSGTHCYSDAHTHPDGHTNSHSYLYAHADSHAKSYACAPYPNASPSYPNTCDLLRKQG